MKSKKHTQENVLPHSRAKLDLYRHYLERYLRVLSLTPFCEKINLFDIYCGIGLYKDGNFGSPLITRDTIKDVNREVKSMGRPLTQIRVFINDFEDTKVNNVQKLIAAENLINTEFKFYNLDADEMLDIVQVEINNMGTKERSLVFIDPYGYSHIDGKKIYNLIKDLHTEIILFLPIMQMYRFTGIALTDFEKKCYEDLRKFIFSFFPEGHKFYSKKVENVFEYIHELKQALSFNGKFYTCSHYIEREKGNYYALFFITSNIYGLEKMVEAKWKLDPGKGKGYLKKRSVTLFDEQFEEFDKNMELGKLKSILIELVKQKNIVGSTVIYETTLMNEFKPQHANQVLSELVINGKLTVCDKFGNPIKSVGAYQLTYKTFKDKENKVYFKFL